ncbi:MAG TPA: hypothetical protein VGP93_14270, partial [Polyangiaceae bacterium]|nr:hypothetical protein [Polyangiaceae bacterium]
VLPPLPPPPELSEPAAPEVLAPPEELELGSLEQPTTRVTTKGMKRRMPGIVLETIARGRADCSGQNASGYARCARFSS